MIGKLHIFFDLIVCLSKFDPNQVIRLEIFKHGTFLIPCFLLQFSMNYCSTQMLFSYCKFKFVVHEN